MFQIVSHCGHFEWLDNYVARLRARSQSSMPFNGAATRQQNLVSDSAAPTVGDADLKGELKKMNKNLTQLTKLKRQSNQLALGFYISVIALGIAYLLVVSR